jgi:hypothetical protein
LLRVERDLIAELEQFRRHSSTLPRKPRR